MEISLGLQQAVESGKCVLFLGAGIGKHLITNGKPLPTGGELAKELCEKFGIEAASEDLLVVSKVVEIQKGRKELESFLHKRFADAQPDEELQWLLSLNWRSIYTTNYDEGIENAFSLNGNLRKKPLTFSLSKDVVDYDPRLDVPIIHLHGMLYGAKKSPIVITSQDYAMYKKKRSMLFDLLKKDSATLTILYVGYSHRDTNWKILIEELTEEFSPHSLPTAYKVSPNPDPLDTLVLKSSNIETVEGNLSELVKSLKPKISAVASYEDMEKYRDDIPNAFIESFENSPAPVLRLLGSWEYVNEANFNDEVNLEAFLKGDKPSWSLISKEAYFKRDIEDAVYDYCLEHITGSKDKPTLISLLEPAGYGTTTLLMSLAVRLIKDRAGHVFYLKEGQVFNQGDLEFASNFSDEQPIFIIDDAPKYKRQLESVIHRYRELDKRALFIVGSRKNEWYQQAGYSLGGKEFNLEQLSDEEINLLISFLQEHSSLGDLELLSDELRISAIKNNLGKELLVVMREATEGRAFDAILEDEYRKIGNPSAQKIYLIVSCFYQFGSLMRTGLLSELCSINEAKIHPVINKYLDGVIVSEDINPIRGIYGVRPRHKKIAEVVWERCGDSASRDDILEQSLMRLNLTYHQDRDAFESFIRSDKLIDSISTFEGKVQFFEQACRKDPVNPYIWQHYARMLSRSEKYELALDQINKAIEIDPKRILYHTKGKILMDIACNSESIDFARKRLSQSEGEFKRGLNIKGNDEYCLHGLAELYFNWAQFVKETSIEESNEYIAKAEAQISEALRLTNQKEELWILSSKIAEFLGNNPNQISALIKAAHSSNFAEKGMYLLGRYYRSIGQYDKAVELFEVMMQKKSDDPRVALEYGRSLLNLGKPRKEVIAILNLSSLYGYKDPRFTSYLGGLYFLENDFDNSEKVFKESSKQSASFQEKRKLHFKPKKQYGSKESDSLKITGKVVKINKGYVYIEVVGYPENITCFKTKWDNLRLQEGMYIEFKLAFNAFGPVAYDPEERPRLI